MTRTWKRGKKSWGDQIKSKTDAKEEHNRGQKQGKQESKGQTKGGPIQS